MSSGVRTWRSIHQVVQRKRVFTPEQLDQGKLRRCLNSWDLTGLGLGSTLGVGVYVLLGSVALQLAGPSILLSLLIAAVASLFAGLCYAEFGSRVPRAGSAYIYTYVTVGELLAFLIGWNMILEGIFGTASVAKGLSSYLDSMSEGAMSSWFTATMPMGYTLLAPYFDLFAFMIVLILGVLLAVGVRESSSVNNVFALLNMLVILFVIIAGSFTAKLSNWSILPTEVPEGSGVGGFFPYGVWGMLRGAAVCFYGFVGFDVINASGEETEEPRRRIPRAILTVLVIVFLVYTGVAIVLTMMVPYYHLDQTAAVATAFTYVKWDWARWLVSIGAIFGILASLVGSMFPLPRLLYAMASDGLLVHWFAKVSSSGSPVTATLVPACVTAVLAAILDLDQLIMMMCIGTLLSYTIVASCVILLRYRCTLKSETSRSLLRQAMGCGERTPSRAASDVVTSALFLFICVCVATALVGTKTEQPIVPVAVLHLVALILLAIITVQPQTKEELTFKTPCVPLVPCLSIYVNIHLMIFINLQTWIRVIIWIAIGIPVYILCLLIYKRKEDNHEKNGKSLNDKPTVQIIIETATPRDTLTNIDYEGDHQKPQEINKTNHLGPQIAIKHIEPYLSDEIIVQQAVIENHDEKEAKIIDLLDQVLQAEEDSYTEIISLKENVEQETVSANNVSMIHRKSLSELSDAGSDASGQVLSKYDVIAQVHREDLPKVSEEEEKDSEIKDIINDSVVVISSLESKLMTEDANNNIKDTEVDEDITESQDSETNSQTDESGYSDTLDRNVLNDSVEAAIEERVIIPTPPPLDENYFSGSNFKKSHTISSRPTRKKELEIHEEENKPRESVASSNSQDNVNIVFGSERQMSFMSKLDNLFQTKMLEEPKDKLKRSNSTGNFPGEGLTIIRERPALFFNLKKELMALELTSNLKPPQNSETQENNVEDSITLQDSSMSRADLKSKLETILAGGGPKLLKPRKMQSNPPTPEEAYQTDTSSSESLPQLPKMEKNDTLKRQKDKFGEVLNSFKLIANRDEIV